MNPISRDRAKPTRTSQKRSQVCGYRKGRDGGLLVWGEKTQGARGRVCLPVNKSEFQEPVRRCHSSTTTAHPLEQGFPVLVQPLPEVHRSANPVLLHSRQLTALIERAGVARVSCFFTTAPARYGGGVGAWSLGDLE